MIYLFSSNAYPQYAQDILNLLGAPSGYKMTFRYDEKYVDQGALDAWVGLQTHQVLVHFVLQQKHHYHTPVLFPVRQGRVVSARRAGQIHLIDFTVDEFITLPPPDATAGFPEHTAEYRRALEEHRLPLPYDKYAILSEYDAIEERLPPLDSQEAFELLTEYLVRTETFSDARFAYVWRFAQAGSAQAEEILIDSASHAYRLRAENEYSLEFIQSQPGFMGSTSIMDVVLDGKVLQSIGPSQLTIGSPYDVQAIRIVALPTTGDQYTTIGLRPERGVRGPILDIPVKVEAL